MTRPMRLVESRVDCPPEGYAKISQQQVVNADRRLFVKLAELTRSQARAGQSTLFLRTP